MNKPFLIDLGQSLPVSVQALVGEENGQNAINAFDLKSLENDHSQVLVRIPPQIQTVTQSFIKGAFFESIKRLGKKAFNEKYKFIASQPIYEKIQTHLDALEIKIRLENEF